ncbi:hypothetical protein IAD21_00532 [Abditibacteriota bacterium]|nr:hypothetical protein IAD21_00532 [Abditibacteriota bacterium]
MRIEYEGGMKVVIRRFETKKLVRIFFDNKQIVYDLQTKRVVSRDNVLGVELAAAQRYCEENSEFLLSQWDKLNP